MRVFSLMFALSLAACAAPSPRGDAHDLRGTQWRRVDRAADAAHPPTMAFDRDGRASGSTGCNHWGAQYQLIGDRLTYTDAMMTEMACDEALMASEAAFGPLLQTTRFGRRDGDSLVLLDLNRAQIARLEPAP